MKQTKHCNVRYTPKNIFLALLALTMHTIQASSPVLQTTNKTTDPTVSQISGGKSFLLAVSKAYADKTHITAKSTVIVSSDRVKKVPFQIQIDQTLSENNVAVSQKDANTLQVVIGSVLTITEEKLKKTISLIFRPKNKKIKPADMAKVTLQLRQTLRKNHPASPYIYKGLEIPLDTLKYTLILEEAKYKAEEPPAKKTCYYGKYSLDTTAIITNNPKTDQVREYWRKIPLTDLGGYNKEKEYLLAYITNKTTIKTMPTNRTRFDNKGVLLTGVEGVGKKSLAHAVLYHLDLPITIFKSSMLLGLTTAEQTSLIEDLFKKTRDRKNPAAILITDINKIASSGVEVLSKLSSEMENTVANENICIVATAATSKQTASQITEMLEEIPMALPEMTERAEILCNQLSEINTADGLDVPLLAQMTKGFTPAQLAAVCQLSVTEELKKYIKSKLDPHGMCVSMQSLKKAINTLRSSTAVSESFEEPEIYPENIVFPQQMLDRVNKRCLLGAEASMPVPMPKGIVLSGRRGSGKKLLAIKIAEMHEAEFVAVNIDSLTEESLRMVINSVERNEKTVLFMNKIELAEKTQEKKNRKESFNILLRLLDLCVAERVFVIATTENPQEVSSFILDPKRLSEIVYMKFLGRNSRRCLIQKLFGCECTGSKLVEFLTEQTEHCTGSEIVKVVQGGILEAGKAKRTKFMDKRDVEVFEKADFWRSLNTMQAIAKTEQQKFYKKSFSGSDR